MKKNVGTYDAFIRISCGLTGLAWGIASLIRRPNGTMPWMVTMASAMKVAEGVTRFCPMLAMLGKESVEGKISLTGTRYKNSAAIDELAQEMEQETARDEL